MIMKNTKKVVYTTTWAIAGIIIASVFWAYASGTGDTATQKITSGVKNVLQIEDNEKEWVENENEKDNEKGWVEEKEQAETPESEAVETAKLVSQATITEAQAKITANTSYTGTVKKVSLDDEDGTIVYSVEYTDWTDVKVDANTNVVVKTDATSSDEKDGVENEKDEVGNEKDNWKDWDNIESENEDGANDGWVENEKDNEKGWIDEKMILLKNK